MLNWNTVLKYVKGNIALPSSFIEKNEKEIQDWITEETIPQFSQYFPDAEFTAILPHDKTYKHPSKSSHYLIFDEEELPVYDIRMIYFPMDGDLFTGHPPFGAFSFEGMTWWSLSVFKSRFFRPYSMWAKTYKFFPPNVVRILPNVDETMTGDALSTNQKAFVVEYEREQPHDLRRIPASLEPQFKKLALSDVMIWIGNIRTQYGDGRITTPFGEIPLNGENLKNDGRDLHEKTIEILADEAMPPIVVDIE